MDGEQAVEHVKVLAILNALFGALMTVVTFVAVAIGGILWSSGEIGQLDQWEAALALTAATLALSIMIIVAGLAIVAAWGLWHHRPWGRILGFVTAGLAVANVPVGTVFGLYAIWVLTRPETVDLFKRPEATG